MIIAIKKGYPKGYPFTRFELATHLLLVGNILDRILTFSVLSNLKMEVRTGR